MTPQQAKQIRNQMRGFVVAWMFVTVLLSAAVFVAIYAAYGALTPNPVATSLNDPANDIALPLATQTLPSTAVAAVVVSPSALPTLPPTLPPPTAPPTATSEPVQAQVVPTETAVPPTPVPPTPTLLPVRDTRYQLGIQVQQSLDMNPDNQDGWLRDVRDKLGFHWFKQQVRWEDMEHVQGQYDWAKLDLVMPSAQRFNLKVMLSIVGAPEWAREPGVNLEKQGPPANLADYVNFVAAILRRYPGQVHAIEVWNEQNIDREWSSAQGLSAANYVTMLRETYTAIKQIDPGVIVISGALSPTGFNDGVGAWDDYVYLEQLIQAGMLNYTDCVGAHANGYNVPPNLPWDQTPNDPTASFRGPFDNPHHSWSFYSTIRGYASIVAKAGGTQKICVTEFGWASTEDLGGYPAGFEFANDNTLAEQAEFTVKAFELMKEWDVVWLAFLWNFNYAPQAGWDTNNDNVPYSLIGKDWKFRPVYDAIIQWQQQNPN